MKAGFLIKENENALIVNALFVQNVRGKSKNHAKTVHKGKKVAFVIVRERNQSQAPLSRSHQGSFSEQSFSLALITKKVLRMNLR